MRRCRRLQIEAMEAREVPATLVSPTTVTYQDVDGDVVTVLATKPIFTAGNANNVFKFDIGTVSGANVLKQQLRKIDLTAAANVNGTNLTITAVPSSVNGGDGHVNIGFIDASNLNLGTVVVAGDLGRIHVGNFDPVVSALKGLTVRSIGRLGIDTQEPVGADLHSDFQGRVDKLIVRSDVLSASITAASVSPLSIGSLFIGGSLRAELGVDGNASIKVQGAVGSITIKGDVAGDAGKHTGLIQVIGNIGPVAIGGSLVGWTGDYSGCVLGSKNVGQFTVGGSIRGFNGDKTGYVLVGGNLAGLTVRGSVIGGYGSHSGMVESLGNMGAVLIRGNVIGSPSIGGGDQSGFIYCHQKMLGMVGGLPVGFQIGGSVLGGDGHSSGVIAGTEGIGPARIVGDLVGGSSTGDSGKVDTGGRLESLAVGGSVVAGYGSYSGYIGGGKLGIGSVSIGGDLRGGGSGNSSASIESLAGIGSVTIGGSFLTNGNQSGGHIEASGVIGKILIKGSIVGTDKAPAMIAMGHYPSANSNVVLGSLTVLGNVIHANVEAGYDDPFGYNADAQIGVVSVGGDWVASNLVAGAVDGGNGFGNSLDGKISGASVKDVANVHSKIGSVTIGGQLVGTIAANDHFGIVAEEVGAMKIGGVTYALAVGTGNDDMALGATGDVNIKEI